jgi:ATP-binding cassette subfamily C protein
MLMTGIYKEKNVIGDIILNGLPIHRVVMNHFREKCISVMLQQSFTVGLTVREYISSFLSECDLQRILSTEYYRTTFACSEFNIMETMEKNFDHLSGGEKQLINLFICLTKDASLYILDEPTSNIFPDLRENIIEKLQQVVAEGKIIVVSTHDKELVTKSVPYVLK